MQLEAASAQHHSHDVRTATAAGAKLLMRHQSSQRLLPALWLLLGTHQSASCGHCRKLMQVRTPLTNTRLVHAWSCCAAAHSTARYSADTVPLPVPYTAASCIALPNTLPSMQPNQLCRYHQIVMHDALRVVVHVQRNAGTTTFRQHSLHMLVTQTRHTGSCFAPAYIHTQVLSAVRQVPTGHRV
jgi:hypothetical protein